jgi:hypothetical protein
MLAHVVAHAQHQRAIHAFRVRELRRDGGGQHAHAIGPALEVHLVQALLEGRRAHDHLAGAIHHEGIAVEHQLVLTAQQVHVHHGQSQVAHAAPDDVLAIALLVDFEGRGVQHHEHLGAGGFRQLRGLGLPDVLADQDADAKTAEIHHRRLAARLEIALLVEDLVVGQAALAMRGAHLPTFDERGGIEDLRAGVLREADEKAAAGLGATHGGHALLHRDAEAPMEQQVFGWIAAERELGQHQQVRVQILAGTLRGRDDLLRIARDIAHEQVQLPEGEAQTLLGCVHRVRLLLARGFGWLRLLPGRCFFLRGGLGWLLRGLVLLLLLR